ncbi:MAG: hypothetical protein K940chlam3_01235 [Chlamydiae bacterium]|nr:hypothetical protein [Chlamydiota bacterium]
MSLFHVGTSGWSYEGWKGFFYPEDLRSKDFLDFYCQHFDCVELNSSFYRLPTAETVNKWKHQTPNDFLFCTKLSRYITHVKKLHDVEESLRNFLKRFKNLKPKMGPILVQLPPQVKFTNPNVEDFFKLLRRYRSFEFAIETRHKSWISDEALEFLEQKEMTFVIADWKNGYPTRETVTSDTVYLRFHGKDYGTKYTNRELSQYAKKTKNWLAQGKEVWAFFNNDAYGYAVENAQTFKKIVLSN